MNRRRLCLLGHLVDIYTGKCIQCGKQFPFFINYQFDRIGCFLLGEQELPKIGRFDKYTGNKYRNMVAPYVISGRELTEEEKQKLTERGPENDVL